ncbi:MAG: sialidase, partial [Bacteroidales bacterium]|nr:sialidase [Bacteroidales bacterium]
MITIKAESKIIVMLLVIFYGISPALKSQQVARQNYSATQRGKAISQFFSPPQEYRNEFGDLKSPLIMNDGTTVSTPGEWKKRRKEIQSYWHHVMGEWPPFIRDQEMEILETSVNEGITQHKIRFLWLPGVYTEGYLLIPHGKGKRPAVITVYYEPETAIGKGKSPYRDFALHLALRGFITLSLGTSETTESRTFSLYYPDIKDSEIQPLSVLAYAAANAWYLLAGYKGIDEKRIGIVGHSYGGKWAMFASCLFDRFACAVWSDPGIVFDETRPNVNYWEPWYLGYYPPPWGNTWRRTGLVDDAKGAYPMLISEGHDLHELHALMAPRPFLVSGGSEDTPARWPALNHTIAVNELLGYRNRVAMTNRPEHSP